MQDSSNDSVIVLHKDLFVSMGASRECYVHPADPNKCIKVDIDAADNGSERSRYELAVYSMLKEKLNGYIVNYDDHLIQTDRGSGLVCELLRDEDGRISESLASYMKRGGISPDLKQQMDRFFELLFADDLYFYDFNLKNFIIQKKSTGEFLKYIDIKGYRRTKALIKMENIFKFSARGKMKRRMHKLYRQVGLV